MKLLEDKCALITGGGRGIGKAIALDFAKNGANVAVSSRTKSDLDSVVEEIESHGVRGIAIPADHSTIEDVRRSVKEYFNIFEKCDVLVANAGMTHFSTVVDFPLEESVKLFNLNIIGTYTLIKEMLPSMIKEKSGRILITSSVQGNVYFVSNKVAYATSKAAVAVMGKSLQSEVGPHKIGVNVILPGGVNTNMIEYLTSLGQKSGKLYPPEYVSAIYLFLVSNLAKKKYRGRVINQQALFSGLYQIQPLMKDRTEDFKTTLVSLRDQLGKEIYSLISKNSELVQFLLEKDFEFHSAL